MLRMNFENRRNRRKEDAAKRQTEYNELTPQQKLDKLPREGAIRARAKILAALRK